MYNEELKARFVQGYTKSISTAKLCETIFNAVEPYEVQWGADLCTRNAEELQPVIENITGFRLKSKWSRIIILKDYVKWCMTVANVPNACDGMLQVNSAGLDKIKQQMVASPLHLQKYLDQLYDDESMHTTDNIYRCYYWLAYGGVAEEDIIKIKCKDVDFSNMVVHYNGTEVPIYREAIQAFKNCVELTQFVYNHPNYNKTVWKDRAEGDTVVRGIRSTASVKYLRVELSRKAKSKEEQTGIRLSYYRAWLSGIFYRAYEREAVGETPNFRAVASAHMDGKVYKLDSGRNTEEAKKRQLAKDYMSDYQRWKLAFKI